MHGCILTIFVYLEVEVTHSMRHLRNLFEVGHPSCLSIDPGLIASIATQSNKRS